MYLLLDKFNIVQEIIPDIDPLFPEVPIEDRYTSEFYSHLMHVDDSIEVHQNWVYEQESGTFYEPDELPRIVQNTSIYTDLESAQQEITDRELDAIEQGQAMTSLELITIEQNQILNVLTGSDTNDNL